MKHIAVLALFAAFMAFYARGEPKAKPAKAPSPTPLIFPPRTGTHQIRNGQADDAIPTNPCKTSAGRRTDDVY